MRLLSSGDYVVSEAWPAGNFRKRHPGMTIRSRYRLWFYGLPFAFHRPFQQEEQQQDVQSICISHEVGADVIKHFIYISYHHL